MTRNIILTSLEGLNNDRALRYYSVQKEFGFEYCEALQSMEASTKFILSRFPIDEILVIGEEGSNEEGDSKKTFRLKDGSSLYSEDQLTLSAFNLYRSRIAQYIDELSLEQKAYDSLLPEEVKLKIIDFIRDFQEKNSKRETKRLNRFFDELSGSRQLFQQFSEALLAAVPETRKGPLLAMIWVKNYLYIQLKPTFKLEILPANENIRARYIPASMLENRDDWFENIFDVDQNASGDQDEINLYLSLGNDSVVDPHLLQNMLNILVSTPGSKVHLKKIYKVSEPAGDLTGEILDNTSISMTADLVAAAHAFLNYSKTDMLVDFWENCGAHDERISSLIYAARHVDIGISMCNIPEVQEGILQLRRLFNDKRSWTANGEYGLIFGIIAGCIQADYKPMLEGDGDISFIELIKWAYRHQLYQQVLTLIETHAPTHLVNSGIFYYCGDEKESERVTKLLGLERMELKPYEYYKMDDISHYFIKNYDRGSVRLNGSRDEDRNMVYAEMRAKSIDNKDPDKISGHTACGNIETVKNVLYAYFNLGTVRNKISHSDSDAMAEKRLIVSKKDVSYAMHLMMQSIEYFIMNYEKALAETKGKTPKIVYISSDDVRKAADSMKRERNQNDRPYRK